MAIEAGSLAQDDAGRRQELLCNARKELLERQFSNSEGYDKAILTLSSGFLALSLTFIKDVAGVAPLTLFGLLCASWVLFALAIICTVLSFRLSDWAISRQLVLIERYYLERDEGTAVRSSLAGWVEACNVLSGTLFVLGVMLTVIFVITHFPESRRMNDPSGPTLAQEERDTTSRGHSIPRVQRVPAPEPRNQAGAPGSGPVSPTSPAAPAPTAATEK